MGLKVDDVVLMRLAMEIAIETGKASAKRVVLIYHDLVAEFAGDGETPGTAQVNLMRVAMEVVASHRNKKKMSTDTIFNAYRTLAAEM